MNQLLLDGSNSARRCSKVIAVTAIAFMLCAFSQVSTAEDEPLPYGEEAFEAFDLATTTDVRRLLRIAEEGDLAAQYAFYLVAYYGLQGRQVNLEVSSSFLRKANSEGPFETETVTQLIPGGNGRPAQARIVERPVNARVRAFSRAHGDCLAEILGTRPNPNACGATLEDRERRKAAWRSASSGVLR